MPKPGDVNNPTGKGGFQERPGDRGKGHWNPENTFKYQFQRFKNMERDEFIAWPKSEGKKTIAMDLAYARVAQARLDRKDFEIVANRTEGYPQQAVDVTSDGEKLEGLMIYKPSKDTGSL